MLPVSPGTGATLRMLAATSAARAVLEVGTGTGVSTQWTLSGMPADGVLTSIDMDPQLHQVAKEILTASQGNLNRVRMIAGRALQVLPRMSKGAYDMAIIDADPLETPSYIELATPALRRGGILVVPHALWKDSVADPARREADTVALREVVKSLRHNEEWTANLLPVGDGMLVGIKNW